MLYHAFAFHFVLLLSSFLLHGYITFILLSDMDIWVVSDCWLFCIVFN